MRLSTPAALFSSHLLALPALVAAALGVAGCGGSAAEAKSAGGDLTDADSALAELNRAEGEITAFLGPASGAEAQATAAPVSPPAPTPAESAPTALQAKEPGVKADQMADSPATDAGSNARGSGSPSASSAPDPCSIACRALASMERAANHLCGIEGEGGPSCTNARDRVRSATDRVSARCPCSK
jgi:hypothetical protein